MKITDRSKPNSVALETTLPALGLPPGEGLPFSVELNGIIRDEGAEPCAIGVLGGTPIDGERHIWCNFASSSKERIEQAKADWKAGKHNVAAEKWDDVLPQIR